MDIPTRPAASPLDAFHPAVASWFARRFPAPTDAQARAWPLIQARRSTLVAAPTGSGKTLTAFLCAIDELVRDALAGDGTLPDATLVLYVSPLKALSNDIRTNLDAPLAGIAHELAARGLPVPGIRTAVRTGDTTQAERAALRKRAPHILVTTPESLYVLLSSESGRRMLATVRTVIVDEIHALAGNKRGSHLALSLARLDALAGRALPRIGLSATQKPIGRVARFLVGVRGDAAGADRGDAPGDDSAPPACACAIVDVGHARERDLALELPPAPLDAVMSTDVWERVYDRIAELAALHRTTLVFVNTRRMAERLARHLGERLGQDAIAAHHGSLAKEARLDAEQRLKQGRLRLLVATASLELGIDIGEVELVCQIGSPRGIAPFLQRVGRSGHHVGGTPKGRLFPLSRDELVECAALLDCVARGELDRLRVPHAPLDVLAQQIVAEVTCAEWDEAELWHCLTRAAPYADLARERFDAVLAMLAEGYSNRRGPRRAYLHRDDSTGTVRAKRGARLTAVTSGGTIPDTADYSVLLEPQGTQIGTVNEDFAIESLAGDVFQLGNQSYRILRVESGRVRVEDARGQTPNIPFWLGEAPGRSDELSAGVARLRGQLDALLAEGEAAARDDGASNARLAPALAWLTGTLGLAPEAARQIADYLARSRSALGALPTQDTLVMERFFDESGGTQLVIHAPFGNRVNRAWGLALRKRFCRTFNFELQAAATDDAIILSLSLAHSFVLDEVWRYLRAATAEHVLVQALLDAPLFGVRWRWNATTALALPRFTGGRRTAPQLQRMKSDDLLATVFPDQVACLENLAGEREIPSHPLVDQTLDDCLHDVLDTDAWLALLGRIEAGAVRLVARDLPAPSPLAAEILNAKPYAFLDDAPLEERRTQAVLARRWSDPESADDLGALDADAIDAVRAEAWPIVRDADEVHDALASLACVADEEARAHDGWQAALAQLSAARRVSALRLPGERRLWLPAERVACLRTLYPGAKFEPALAVPKDAAAWTPEAALVDVIRARLTGFGPLPLAAIAAPLGLPESAVQAALATLEAEGYVMRGRFSPGTELEQWCERHLLARIHRYTVKRLRREIEPVERADFMRFLLHWQHASADTRGIGQDALAAVVEQLEGFEAAAGAWEEELLPTRVADYGTGGIDALCRSGRIVWTRIAPPSKPAAKAPGGPVKTTPIVLLPRRHVAAWQARQDDAAHPVLSARAARVHDALAAHGAMFFDELLDDTRLLPVELEQALGELVAAGRVNADSFAGLRALLRPAVRRGAHHAPRTLRGGALIGGMDDAGRWSLVRRPVRVEPAPGPHDEERKEGNEAARESRTSIEHLAWTLLRRYGVVFWRLLEREAAWLPPWRELLRVYQRLEARGEIRGGRFVAGLAGEQFALPEAIPVLREIRRQPADGQWVAVSGADPLNLAGTLLPGRKVPALAGNRVLFRDGVAVAALVAGEFVYDDALPAEQRETARLKLARRR